MTSQYPGVTNVKVYNNANTLNLGYLGYNPNLNEVFLVFRGTMMSNLNNVLQDITMVYTTFSKCSNCNIHQGFQTAYNNLVTTQYGSSILSDLVSLYKAHPTAKVIITGHSLGGAMATLGFVDACAALRPLGANIDLYTYGAPRVGDSAFSNYVTNLSCGGDKIRVTHLADPVPHNPSSAFGYKHAGSEVWYSDSASTSSVYCQNPEDSRCSNSVWLAFNISDHMNYMNFALINC